MQISAAELQLQRASDPGNCELLLKATHKLSNRELFALDDELNWYSETGLVGVLMSKLMFFMESDELSEAA